MTGANIVGVQFRRAGKIYDFNAKSLLLSLGDQVVVETERGPSLAEVKRILYSDEGKRDLSSLKPVMRIATEKDRDSAGRLVPDEVLSFTRERVIRLKLDMRVIGVDIQFGGNKVIIYFTAPGRVDFRELVKELATGLKSRVELKQVGARDEAKQVGGLGICGREFCCSSFLREFVPVSIRMAKNQNLALNPSKVSGGCGRLLCCLTYENDIYKELRQKLPPRKSTLRLADGTTGIMVKGDVLNQKVRIQLESGDLVTAALADVEVLDKKAVAAQKSAEADDWGEDLDLGELMDDSSPPQAESTRESRGRGRRPPRDRDRPRGGGRGEGGRERDGGRDRSGNRPPGRDEGSGGDNPEGKKRRRNRKRNRRKKKSGDGGDNAGGSGGGGGGGGGGPPPAGGNS